MVGCTIPLMSAKPEWINSFLGSKFFEGCEDHRGSRKNEKNVFCIDCSLCFCKHCITSPPHSFHRWLQVCKYVYQDVVRLQDVQKYLDCSKIQTYKINGEKAVHLNSRPQTRDPKPSKSKSGVPCEACGRHIQDFPNQFCSIACKVSLVAEMSNDDNNKSISIPVPGFGGLSLKESFDSEVNTNEKESSLSLKESTLSVSESCEEFQSRMNSALKPRKQLRKRKGVPCRAPFR